MLWKTYTHQFVKKASFSVILLLVLLCAIVSMGAAQPGTMGQAHGSTPPKPSPPKAHVDSDAVARQKNEKVQQQNNASNDSGSPEILDVRIEDLSNSNYSKNILHPNYKISVLISHPLQFLAQRPADKSDLILYAEGLPLTGMISPYFKETGKFQIDTSKVRLDTLRIPFIFLRDSTTKEAWNALFRLAHWDHNQINFKLSMGWSGMFPLTYTNKAKVNPTVTLVFYDKRVFWILLIAYLALIAYFVHLCNTTGLIRDPDLNNKGELGPFSLSQTQLAFWTVIIVGGFIYLVILTGLCDSLNDSCLLLLGISGGTTGIASFIDFYKKRNVINNNPAIQEGDVNPSKMFVKEHRGFLHDILSDGVNISVQRSQIFIWNLVLGLYFIWYVIDNKSMPVFSNTLLLLAGVSSTLYLASKGPEKPNTIDPGTSSNAADPGGDDNPKPPAPKAPDPGNPDTTNDAKIQAPVPPSPPGTNSQSLPGDSLDGPPPPSSPPDGDQNANDTGGSTT